MQRNVGDKPKRDAWQCLIDAGKIVPAEDPDPRFDPPKGPPGDWASKSLQKQRAERL